MIEPPNPLTPAGQRRREQILERAIADATHRRYSRIERRLGLVFVAAFCLTGMLILQHRPVVQNGSLEIARLPPALPQVVARKPEAPGSIAIVPTDPHILEQLSVAPAPPRWTIIGDDELLATLAESGHPAGLIEINGQTRIIFR